MKEAYLRFDINRRAVVRFFVGDNELTPMKFFTEAQARQFCREHGFKVI